MKKFLLLPIVCMCFFLSACAAGQNSSSSSAPPPPTSSAPAAADMRIPLMKDSPAVFVQVTNNTKASEDLEGTILAFMQSEHGASIVDFATEADYVIYVTLEKFGMLGTEKEAPDAAQVAIPALLGVSIGSQVGGSFGTNGAWIGAGIGLIAGLALGNASSEEVLVWHMDASVKVKDAKNAEYATKLTPKTKGAQMSADVASATLQNSIAWSVVRSFSKK